LALSLRAKTIIAFTALYLVWGSTYLGIRYAIETMPPLLMVGVRFAIAGALLYAVARRGQPAPTRPQWRTAVIVGSMLMGGNASVAVAEQRIPSGIAALLVALSPLFMVLVDWAWPGGKRPPAAVAVGLFMGIVGIVILIGPGEIAGSGGVDLVGAGTVLLGAIVWCVGSIYARHAPRTESSFLMSGMQMLSGGALLALVGVGAGELRGFDIAAVSRTSIIAFVYLICIGSLVGFTAYIYLLRVSTAARVSTYAYVNPVVAVFLGWAIAGEPISARMLVASAVIIAGVIVITTKAK
jgi:drug/metabolite transporter (DMT)-like permease